MQETNFRTHSRQAALQVMYQMELTGEGGDCKETAYDIALKAICSELSLDGATKEYASRLLRGTMEEAEEIDAAITAASKNWTIDRMGVVERSILRLAAFELIFCKEDVPFKVAIDEALELVRRFGSDDSVSFVNGILDNIAKE